MSEAMGYLLQILKMVETAMNDASIDSQLCAKAKSKIDDAFTAMDEACAAQGKFEDS